MQPGSRGNLFTQKLGIFLDDTYPRLRSLRRRVERVVPGVDLTGYGVVGILCRDSGVTGGSWCPRFVFLMIPKA